jgi:cytochrome c biogenesis protein CcdA
MREEESSEKCSIGHQKVAIIYKILEFLRRVVEVFVFLEIFAASVGSLLQTFRDSVTVHSSRIKTSKKTS